MVVLLIIGLLFFVSFIYSALVVAKQADEYVYDEEKE